VASEARLFTLAAAVIVWLMVSGAFGATNYGGGFRLINFVPFDASAALFLVLSFVAWRGMRAHDRESFPQARFILVAVGAVAALFATPYLAYSVAHLDTRAASLLGAPRDVVTAQHETLLPHLLITGGFAILLVIEVKTGVLEQAAALARSAFLSVPRTLVDVLRTLPVVLTVLFFVAFTADTWQVFGVITFGRLVALIALLLGCLVISVVWLARSEADRFRKEASQTIAAQPDDPYVIGLRSAGVTPAPLAIDKPVKNAIVRQWISHIGLRIGFAGLVVTGLIWVASALTMTPEGLHDWLGTTVHAWLDESLLGVHIYLTPEGLKVAAVLGAFASVVFAGLALGAQESRNDLLEPERKRLERLLTLAGTYRVAVEDQCWRARAGMTWSSYSEFLADDPARWKTQPLKFGNEWSDDSSDGPNRHWRAAWNQATGELYVHRWPRAGAVLVLAVCERTNESILSQRLAGWQKQETVHGSLRWLWSRAQEITSETPH
jgi:hypothetical protein